MHHLLEHINQDTTRRQSKDKDSTVNKTEYRSKRNPTGELNYKEAPMLDSIYQMTLKLNYNHFFRRENVNTLPSFSL